MVKLFSLALRIRPSAPALILVFTLFLV